MDIVQCRNPPSLRIEPDKQIVPQGTLAELRCLSTTDPSLQVQWIKINENLTPNVQVCIQLYLYTFSTMTLESFCFTYELFAHILFFEWLKSLITI